MKKLLLVAAFMVASFSFANESNNRKCCRKKVQTVSVETQQTKTMFLTTDVLL